MGVGSEFGESIEAHDLVVRINYATSKGAKRSIGLINLGPIAMSEKGDRRPRALGARLARTPRAHCRARRQHLDAFKGSYPKSEAMVWP